MKPRTGVKRSSATRRSHQRQLRLTCETLEARRLLVISNLGTIAGVAYDDLTGDGLSNDDNLIPGVQMTLFRDDGNGTFDGGDTQLSTATTDANGAYEFSSLAADTYFVQQTAPAGFIQLPNSDVQTFTISTADAQGTAGTVVDDYLGTPQTLTVTAATPNQSSAEPNAMALGGERDIAVTLSNGTGTIVVSANASTPGFLEINPNSTSRGRYVVTWDGTDGDANTLDPIGLRGGGASGVDLTDGGASDGFRFDSAVDKNGQTAIIRVYTDANNFSEATVSLANTGGAPDDVYVPYATSFVAMGASGGADFTNVGAVEMDIDTTVVAMDGLFDLVGAIGPTVATGNFANFQPLSVGDLVWDDRNNNGVFDSATESGIAGVTVNLLEDTDNSQSFTAGVDTVLTSMVTGANGDFLFSNLFPGDYLLQIPNADFSGVLDGFQTSSGNDPAPDPDDNTNNDDNGSAVTNQGVVSGVITLVGDTEPINDGDTDPDTNLTVDFGVLELVDLEISKTDSIDPVIAGNSLTYTLNATNNGPSDATNVVITDTLPAGVTFDTASASQGSVSHSNGVVTADLGTLTSGGAAASVTINVDVDPDTRTSLSNTATISGDQFDTNSANNSATETTAVNAETDLVIVKTDQAATVLSGGPNVYTITVSNIGPSTATGVTVQDILPGVVTYTSGSATQGTVTENAGTVTANLGSIAPGAAPAVITVNVDVDSDATGNVVNTATVSGNETETSTANNSDDVTTALSQEVDLVITKVDSIDPAFSGQSLNYTIEVQNNGPSDATGVVVTDTLPTELTVTNTTVSQGTSSQVNNVVTANLGTIVAGQTATITLSTSIASSATGTISNTATVTANETEQNAANNTVTEPTTVRSEVDLQLTKTESSDPVMPGDTLTYTLEVTNNGPSVATGVVITDVLPANVTVSNLTTSQGTVTDNAGTITASLGSLNDGAMATVTIEVQVAATMNGTLTNSATVSSNETEMAPNNNTASVDTDVSIDFASIAGEVFYDRNANGVRGSDDVNLSGITITLTGTDLLGNPVNQTQTTDANGRYLFDNLVPGTYTVTETQPVLFRDGESIAGTGASGTEGTNTISQITVGPGADATGFNFTEGIPLLSKRRFLASAN